MFKHILISQFAYYTNSFDNDEISKKLFVCWLYTSNHKKIHRGHSHATQQTQLDDVEQFYREIVQTNTVKKDLKIE